MNVATQNKKLQWSSIPQLKPEGLHRSLDFQIHFHLFESHNRSRTLEPTIIPKLLVHSGDFPKTPFFTPPETIRLEHLMRWWVRTGMRILASRNLPSAPLIFQGPHAKFRTVLKNWTAFPTLKLPLRTILFRSFQFPPPEEEENYKNR